MTLASGRGHTAPSLTFVMLREVTKTVPSGEAIVSALMLGVDCFDESTAPDLVVYPVCIVPKCASMAAVLMLLDVSVPMDLPGCSFSLTAGLRVLLRRMQVQMQPHISKATTIPATAAKTIPANKHRSSVVLCESACLVCLVCSNGLELMQEEPDSCII